MINLMAEGVGSRDSLFRVTKRILVIKIHQTKEGKSMIMKREISFSKETPTGN